MNPLATVTLADIVKTNYKAADVLEEYGLEFCCSGHQTLEKACTTRNVNMEKVIESLNSIKVMEGDGVNFDKWRLDELAEYIYLKHHRYVEEKSPAILDYITKICSVHGDSHPELFEIRNLFYQISSDLAVHMKKEELILFPYIKKMVKVKAGIADFEEPFFQTVTSPVNQMMSDHQHEGEELMKLAKLTNNYTVPANVCYTFELTYKLLQEFERDIHMHMHLENNILFEKAIQLEEELIANH